MLSVQSILPMLLVFKVCRSGGRKGAGGRINEQVERETGYRLRGTEDGRKSRAEREKGI